jgi:hypothetical protein
MRHGVEVEAEMWSLGGSRYVTGPRISRGLRGSRGVKGLGGLRFCSFERLERVETLDGLERFGGRLKTFREAWEVGRLEIRERFEMPERFEKLERLVGLQRFGRLEKFWMIDRLDGLERFKGFEGFEQSKRLQSREPLRVSRGSSSAGPTVARVTGILASNTGWRAASAGMHKCSRHGDSLETSEEGAVVGSPLELDKAARQRAIEFQVTKFGRAFRAEILRSWALVGPGLYKVSSVDSVARLWVTHRL